MSLQQFRDRHKGQTAFICGSGCSLRHIKEEKLNGVIFAVNYAIYKFIHADYAVMCDGGCSNLGWYWACNSIIQRNVIKVGEAMKDKAPLKNEVYIEREKKRYVTKDDVKAIVSDTLPTAVHIAYVMGFNRIILLGNDLKYAKSGKKYFTDYAGMKVSANNIPDETKTGDIDGHLGLNKHYLTNLYKDNPQIPLYTVSKTNIGIPLIKNEWV